MPSHKKHQTGVGLIEVLITVLVLSISLMTLAALQTRSLQYNHSAYMASQANVVVYDILDRIRALSPPTGALVEPNTANLLTQLPAGAEVTIESDANRNVTVTITWPEQNSSGNAAEDTTQLIYMTRI
jgi:type IV pilus assembly protein PilV